MTDRAAILRRPVRQLILRCDLPPGDLVMLTAAVRDLHLSHPCRFITDVRTQSPDLWRHNPLLTPLDPAAPGVEVVDCHYPLIDRSNRVPRHCLEGFVKFLARHLRVSLELSLFKGDVYLSDRERNAPSLVQRLTGADLPFWILVAGGKRDYTIKWWDAERWQAVVNRFRGRLLFVQVGSSCDHHPPLAGVLDLRGHTTLRELIVLMHHAQGVLCPVTCAMHLAAAVETRPTRAACRPCVVVAGGREPPHWEAYPGHQFIHTVGTLPCCDGVGCWRSRTLPLADGDAKDDPDQLCQDVVNGLPHCMHRIDPDDVARRLSLYFETAQARYLTSSEAKLAGEFLRRPGPSAAPDGTPVLIGPSAARIELPRRQPPPVTICVVTYGDHLHLIRRCLASIRRHCQRSRYRLFVGGSEVGVSVQEHLLELQRQGWIDRLHLSPVNINKCPMLRRLFAAVETEYVWSFDDDVYICQPGALELWLAIARASPARTVAWGHTVYCPAEDCFNHGYDVRRWIRTASWYRGRPLPARASPTRRPAARAGHNGYRRGQRWLFLRGANWMVRTSALRTLDWPDPRLILTAEDILFGEAIRQQGWRFQNVGSLGVKVCEIPSRGTDRQQIMRLQMEGAAAG